MVAGPDRLAHGEDGVLRELLVAHPVGDLGDRLERNPERAVDVVEAR